MKLRTSLVLFLAALPLSAQALTPSQVFDKVKNSIVVIKTLDTQDKPVSQGSGVLLPSGKIATNCHVVKNGASFQAGRGESLVPAVFYAGDEEKDICLLRAHGFFGTPAQIGQAAALKVGEAVYAVGAPKGLELSLSDGIVSQLRGSPPPLIQTTAAISPGSSGGGLFDSKGRLVGFTTLYIDGGQSLNFAMPVEWLADIKPGKKIVSKQRSQLDWHARVAALEEKQDWPGLLDWGKQWAKEESENKFAWFSMGHAFQEVKRYDEAIAAYRQALDINPEFAAAWGNLGLVFVKLKRYDEAIAAYREALRIYPELVAAWSNLGVAFVDLKRYDEAIAANRRALEINPDDAYAWNNLGIAYRMVNRYDDAIAAYRRSIQINSENVEPWNNLGFAYGMMKRYDDAVASLLQALKINPEYTQAWHNLADGYSGLNRHEDAIAAYRKVLSFNPETASAWRSLGSIYGKLKRYDESIAASRQALRFDPKDAAAWGNLAFAYYRSGNTTAALQAVKSLRPLDPARADKLLNLIVPQ